MEMIRSNRERELQDLSEKREGAGEEEEAAVENEETKTGFLILLFLRHRLPLLLALLLIIPSLHLILFLLTSRLGNLFSSD